MKPKIADLRDQKLKVIYDEDSSLNKNDTIIVNVIFECNECVMCNSSIIDKGECFNILINGWCSRRFNISREAKLNRILK